MGPELYNCIGPNLLSPENTIQLTRPVVTVSLDLICASPENTILTYETSDNCIVETDLYITRKYNTYSPDQ